MELDERKVKILKAIIRNYQETGEPVGSRTISKYSDLKLSSATIRNEMADLEEMGLITQPHTSAGRVPTDKAYRMYVEQLMRDETAVPAVSEEVETHALATPQDNFLLKRVDRLELLLEQIAKVVAANTNYAAMVSSPRYNRNKLKFIQLSKMDAYKLLVVVVVEGNIVRNTIFEADEDVTQEEILSLNVMLNSQLNGLSIDEINLGVITELNERAGSHRQIISKVLDAVADAIRLEESVEIYTSGTKNIFRYPELTDGGKASEIISTFEEKRQLAGLLTDGLKAEGETGIQVYIGEEMPVQSMKDCSVVTATYELSDGLKGTIGIVGPKRMDYEKVMNTLQTTMAQLGTIYKK